MTIKAFPVVESADPSGVLAIGGDLEVESLLLAYRSGIFPWPMDDFPLLWWAVPKRALLYIEEFKISRSLVREIKRAPYEIKFNSNFRAVIEGCANAPRNSKHAGTWITPEMIEGYTNLHKAGFAYSIEAYKAGKLVGGLYGVQIERFVSAESMYHIAPNASKLCLVALVDKLRVEKIKWIDLQVINPFTKTLGAREVTRNKFMKLLAESL